MKKLLTVLLALVMVFTFAACGSESTGDDAAAPAETYELMCASIYPVEHIDCTTLQAAFDNIEAKTNGGVKITLYPSNQLGDYTQVYEEIMKGTIDMGAITVPTNFDQRLEMLTLPFITSSYDDAKVKFASGSAFFDACNEIQNELGVEMLGIFIEGYMGIGATKHIDNPMTVGTTHNELLRVPAMDSYIWTAQGMGYNTTTIAYADLYAALQTGVCDGWIGGSAYVNYESFRDVIKYYAETKYICELVPVVINKDLIDGMPAEYSQAIREEMAAAAITIADARDALDKQAIIDMGDMGIEIYECSEEEITAMSDYFKENVWPQYTDLLGEELLDVLING